MRDSVNSKDLDPSPGPSIRACPHQSYQILLYGRALHPELFQIRGRRTVRHGGYEFEAWLMRGTHLLRFEHRTMCATELLTNQEDGLPNCGVLTGLPCAGEHELEHAFPKDRALYMTSVQTETLSENLYIATMKELQALGRDSDALTHLWNDPAGCCMSMLDIQRYCREVHIQAYHLHASGGLVVRTQTIFEHA